MALPAKLEDETGPLNGIVVPSLISLSVTPGPYLLCASARPERVTPTTKTAAKADALQKLNILLSFCLFLMSMPLIDTAAFSAEDWLPTA
jgi:hypothetical protein